MAATPKSRWGGQCTWRTVTCPQGRAQHSVVVTLVDLPCFQTNKHWRWLVTFQFVQPIAVVHVATSIDGHGVTAPTPLYYPTQYLYSLGREHIESVYPSQPFPQTAEVSIRFDQSGFWEGTATQVCCRYPEVQTGFVVISFDVDFAHITNGWRSSKIWFNRRAVQMLSEAEVFGIDHGHDNPRASFGSTLRVGFEWSRGINRPLAEVSLRRPNGISIIHWLVLEANAIVPLGTLFRKIWNLFK